MNNKDTLRTYEKIAPQYAKVNAVNDTVSAQRARFRSYLPKGVLYDFGCGTGRDVHAFSQMGYDAKGFDGSEAMLSMSRNTYPEHSFCLLDMLDNHWPISGKPNGIWACASLLHFETEDFKHVFRRLVDLLEHEGILYFSVKIRPELSAETIDGRFFQYYTKEWLDAFLLSQNDLQILHDEENEGANDCFASYFLKKRM